MSWWTDTYTKIEELGRGSFGVVYKVQWFLSYYAVKEVERVDSYAIQEIEILKSVSHNNIIRYIEHYYDARKNKLAIVMEYADQGTLTTFRMSLNSSQERRLTTENALWNVMNQLTAPLGYLHQKRILHRDLKPDNILCFNSGNEMPTFKLADFGIAKLLNRDAQGLYYAQTRAGTEIYMAPEVLRGEEYTFSADMWAVGAIVSFWYNKTHLFRNVNQVLRWEGGKSTLSKEFQLDIRNLTASLLHPDRRSRPSAKDVNNQSYNKISWCTIL